jgi:hypothetical protein
MYRLAAENLEPALRTADPVRAMEQELAADEALEARAAEDGGELLVERPVQGLHVHSVRNTPIRTRGNRSRFPLEPPPENQGAPPLTAF